MRKQALNLSCLGGIAETQHRLLKRNKTAKLAPAGRHEPQTHISVLDMTSKHPQPPQRLTFIRETVMYQSGYETHLEHLQTNHTFVSTHPPIQFLPPSMASSTSPSSRSRTSSSTSAPSIYDSPPPCSRRRMVASRCKRPWQLPTLIQAARQGRSESQGGSLRVSDPDDRT